MTCSSDTVFHMDSTELEALARYFSTRFEAAIAQRSPFVIREKKNIVRSRRYHLKEIAWDKKKAMWRVRVIKVTDLSNAVTFRKKAGKRAPYFFKRKPGYIFR
jgi:tRNA G10  N-methylase Trm11